MQSALQPAIALGNFAPIPTRLTNPPTPARRRGRSLLDFSGRSERNGQFPVGSSAACSRISDEQAKQRECWEGQPCHNRRSYYRHRQTRNSDRQLKYRLKQNSAPSASVEQPEKIVIAPPLVTKPLAVAFIYSPPTGGAHSIGFFVYQDAKLIATVEAVHCTGWSNLDLAAHTQNVLGDLNSGEVRVAVRLHEPAQAYRPVLTRRQPKLLPRLRSALPIAFFTLNSCCFGRPSG